MNRTRVMIVDDHQVVRAGLRTMINGQPDLAVIAEAGSGREAMDQLRQHTVDVLLLDLSLPDVSGLDVLKHAKAHYESVGVLILSAFPEAQYGLNVLRGRSSGTSVRLPDSVSSPLPGTEITADFDDKGKLTGSAGCNTYNATYTTEGAKITIADVSATEMACDGPDGVMEQEQAYLEALPLAAGYRVEGSRLSLLKADGTYVATYERTP